MIDFDSLYRHFGDKIYAYIYRRIPDTYEAEDLRQIVFLRAIEAERAGTGPRVHTSGWLYRVAHNLVMDHYRALNRHREVELHETHPVEFDPLETPIMEEWKKRVQQSMDLRMTEKQSTVIRQIYMEDHDLDEVAQMNDTNRKAIIVLRWRAVQNLRLHSEWLR